MTKIKRWWQGRLENWLTKRIPSNRQFQMDMSNVFIFPSKFGIAYILLCSLLFILGTNYRNNLMLLLAYFLLAMFLVNLMTSYANFAKLKVQLGKVKSTHAGNDCALPLWLGDSDDKTIAGLKCYGKLHFRLWQGPVQRSIEPESHSNPVVLNIPTDKRGYLTLPRVTIESFYPFGLFRCWTHLHFKAQILVYPNPIASKLMRQSFRDGEEEGEESSSSVGGNNDFDSLKNYVPGESLNRVAWKLVAKGQEMMTKQFADNQQGVIWLDLKHYLKSDLETAIAHLTWLVIELHRKQICFGLTLGAIEIPADSDSQHLELCLKSLALYGIDQVAVPREAQVL
ncbi:DUF58 domain-containing protein [Planctobacterium marinum]|uniref:DUF58 domain-containing protein n=1 Tax=Planctobacterium marinum TaxID=1631968 RepID=A0AA48HKK0_9ALTE|nr:hypothetical protein MACH26_19820 [Planctobacterium marinum]